MKTKQVLSIVTIFAVLTGVIGKQAQAFYDDAFNESMSNGVNDSSEDSLNATALATSFMLVASTLGAVLKQAVHLAAPDAMQVLQGGAPTDAFNDAKALLEEAAGVQYASDEQAALAIIKLETDLQAAQ